MKRNLTLLILLAALVSGCRIHDQVAGSGKIQKQTRDVGSFNSISTEGAFDLEVVSQKPQRVEIEGDDNVLPLITTEVSNNVLHIRSVRGYSATEPIRLEISVPDLVGISTSGAGSVEVAGIKNEKFLIEANGAPAIKAAGETGSLTIQANGAGRVNAFKLRAGRVNVDSKGVSHVEVYATQQLDVTVSGPSTVIYDGEPTVRETVNGPGSVRKKESGGA